MSIRFSKRNPRLPIEVHDTDGIELELKYIDAIEDTIQIVKTPTGYRAGYLVYDENCSSPEDADGVGYIGTSNQRDAVELNHRYQEALGLTRDWERKVTGDNLLDELASELGMNYKDLLRKVPTGDEVFEDTKRQDIKLPYRGRWDQLLKLHQESGDMGDPDAVMLNIYEHGGRIYRVDGATGHYQDANWDWSFGGAVWVPDNVLRNDEASGLSPKKRREMMLKWAGEAVEQMNAWMNGQCFGVVIQDFDQGGNPIGEGEPEETWGVIGMDWAEKELEMGMKL